MAVIEKRIYGIEGWQEVLRKAGRFLADNAENIVVDGEYARSIDIRIKGIDTEGIPVLEITKEYVLTDANMSRIFDDIKI